MDLAGLLESGAISDAGLPPTRGISAQANYPFCGIYAMSSFLELWGNTSGNHYKIAPIDPGFIALAYNREVSSGSNGTKPLWLNYVVWKYGAVPQNSRAIHDNVVSWPITGWEEKHLGLFPAGFADAALAENFLNDTVRGEFTGGTFLQHVVKIDLKAFDWLSSTHTEKLKEVVSSDAPPTLRAKNKEDLQESMTKRLQVSGLPISTMAKEPNEIYELIKSQLDSKRPLLLSINPGLVRGNFGSQRVIGTDQLLPEGEGLDEAHAMVVVGYCDGKGPHAEACVSFEDLMKHNSVQECLIVQNSWGEHSNAKGYLCISRKAMSRMMISTSILHDIVKKSTKVPKS